MTGRAAIVRQNSLLLRIGNRLSLLARGKPGHLRLGCVSEGGWRNSRWGSLYEWSLERLNHDHGSIHERRF